ncbi:tail fiber assembly protein [Pseudomonas sp. OV226]|uniref:tail fiber assembly protein n=1 Tax=Pseudomonas sp. OV226 TaxID=2135588 RepID=UPI000D6D1DD4|nr:tail fiber assembly protein [Pseudomonas sp. OV226]PWK30845.1 virus tail fiber assembly protein lambda gpK [Pseudomonas sp. OV226]
MKTHAYVYSGSIQEIIQPIVYDAEMPGWVEGDPSRIGKEIPITERRTPGFLESTYDITDLVPMPVEGWTYQDGIFAAPVPYQPTPEQILAENQAQQNALFTIASQAMTPFMLSLTLGNATDAETVKAKAWQTYYRELEAVDISTPSPVWPAPPAV